MHEKNLSRSDSSLFQQTTKFFMFKEEEKEKVYRRCFHRMQMISIAIIFLIHFLRWRKKTSKRTFFVLLATSIIGHRSVCGDSKRKGSKSNFDVTLRCPRPLFWIKMYKSLLPRRVLGLLCMYIHFSIPDLRVNKWITHTHKVIFLSHLHNFSFSLLLIIFFLFSLAALLQLNVILIFY